MAKVYVGNKLQLSIEMGEDVSSATAQKLHVKKPDKTTDEWTPTISSTTLLYTTTQDTDLDVAGRYSVTPFLTKGDFTGYGTSVYFDVYNVYD